MLSFQVSFSCLKQRARVALHLVCGLTLMLYALSSNAEGASYIAQEDFRGETFLLPLSEAIAIAVRENRLVQNSYLQRISQKYDLYVAEGKFFPKLTMATTALRGQANGASTSTRSVTSNGTLTLPTGASLSLATTNDRTGSSTYASTAVTFTQPLLKDGGFEASTASVRMARLSERANQLVLSATLSRTVAQVIYSYRELFRAQEQKEIAKTALLRSTQLLDVNRSLIKAGRMAEVEIFQTQAEVANNELALEEAENQIDAARLALLSLLALEPRTSLKAEAPQEMTLKPQNLGEAIAMALAFQPDYLIASLELDRARINLSFAKNQSLWDLSFVAGKAYSRGSYFGLGFSDPLQNSSRNDSSFAGLQLTVPLGDRSVKQAEVRAAVDLETSELAMRQTAQAVEQQVRDAARNVQTRWRQLDLAKRARALSLLKLDAEKEKLRLGRSSNFQVLAFEGDLRNAENAQLNAQLAYLNALTDLEERTGKILENWNIPIVEPDMNATPHAH